MKYSLKSSVSVKDIGEVSVVSSTVTFTAQKSQRNFFSPMNRISVSLYQTLIVPN